MHGRGPFLTQTPPENALALQMFLLMASTPLVLLSVAIEDERRSKEALHVSEERMSLAAESAHAAKLAKIVGYEHRTDGECVRRDDRVDTADGMARFLERCAYFAIRSLDSAIDRENGDRI
jgi:hypothetical protein